MTGKRRVWATALVLLLLCCLFSSLSPAVCAREQTIRVGYIDYGSILRKNADGSATGYGVAYLNEIAQYTGWRYEYHYDTWANCLKLLKNGQIDLVFGAERSSQREQEYSFSKYAVGWELSMLYVSAQNQNVYYDDYPAFNGMRVGMLAGSYLNESFQKFAKEKGFSYTPIQYDSILKAADDVASGVIDAVVAGNEIGQGRLKPVASFEHDPYYIMTSKDNQGLLTPLDDALHKIKTTDVDFENRLYQQFYVGNSASLEPMFTREEVEFLSSKKVLKVACRMDWAPYEYQSKRTNLFSGINILLLERIKELSDIDLSFYGVSSDEQARDLLQKGEIDLVVSSPAAHISEEPGRRTSPFLLVPMIEVTSRKALQKPRLDKAAISEKWRFMELYIEKVSGYRTLYWCRDNDASLQAVEKGVADVALVDALSAPLIKNMDRWIVSQQNNLSLPIGIEISPLADPRLEGVLNKCILSIPSESVNRAFQTAQAELLEEEHWELKRLYLQLVPALLLVFGLALFWIQSIHRKKLERILTLDLLTGSFTLWYFKEKAQKLLLENQNRVYYLLKLDILHFKLINQRYGIETGDKLLVMLVEYGKRELKPWELMARIGDDHFVVLVTEQTMGRLFSNLSLIQKDIQIKLNLENPVTIKCGVYPVEDPKEPVPQMINKADIAHKNTRQSTKNHIVVYCPQLSEQILRENQIESEMDAALENSEFHVYLQPQVTLSTLRPCGAEALIRWIRPDGSMRNPDEFIPLFEQNGFVEKLDFFVLRQVCSWLRNRLEQGKSVLPISVNQSRYLLSNPEYINTVQSIIQDSGVPQQLIELEVTESLCLENIDSFLEALTKLHQAGLRLAIDDFGHGYSALNLLGEIPADVLKLDRAFIKNCEQAETKRLIVRKIVELARDLHIRVICEGVETKRQESFLQDIGCDAAQGFLYARPMPIEAFEQYLEMQRKEEAAGLLPAP